MQCKKGMVFCMFDAEVPRISFRIQELAFYDLILDQCMPPVPCIISDLQKSLFRFDFHTDTGFRNLACIKLVKEYPGHARY